jgi:Uma2 family endonuclease
MLQPSRDRKWTYADYLTWPADERWELIDGVAYAMVPGPMRLHQAISGDLYFLLRKSLEGKLCQVYSAPFDVRLTERSEADEETTTVVQPDISVFCSAAHLDDKGAKGPPDLVVEILSPSTSGKDMIVKRALYERHGVPEYWIVDPETRVVYQFVLTTGRYAGARELSAGMRLESATLDGVAFAVDELFPRP